MDHLMITFQAGDVKVDLKVPVFVTVEELLEMLAEALHLPLHSGNKLQAEPLGRILDNHRTLQQEAVTNGSLLTLV